MRTQEGVLPSNIAIPDMVSRDGASLGSGYLPTSNSHFSLGSDPGKANFKVRDLDVYKGSLLKLAVVAVSAGRP